MAKPSQPQQPGVERATRDTPGFFRPSGRSRRDRSYDSPTEGAFLRSRLAAIPLGSDCCFAFPGVSRTARSTPGCC